MSSRRFSKKQRQHWLAQFGQSNLTATAFCREHKLSYQAFPNWRRKAQPKKADTPTEFIEVEVPTATPVRHNGIVELIFPGGLKISKGGRNKFIFLSIRAISWRFISRTS